MVIISAKWNFLENEHDKATKQNTVPRATILKALTIFSRFNESNKTLQATFFGTICRERERERDIDVLNGTRSQSFPVQQILGRNNYRDRKTFSRRF